MLAITFCIFTGERYGRSVNINLSFRGKQSLRAVGIEEKILRKSVTMKAKIIHPLGKPEFSVPLSIKGEMQGNTVDRTSLYNDLLTEAEACPNVSVYFQHKLTEINFKTMTLTFVDSSGPTPKEVTVRHDFIFGCDGAYSMVREEMKRHDHINFQQEYAYHGYKELVIPPTLDAEYALEEGHLHIWGQDEHVAVGVPNVDQSFRINVVFPFENFSTFQTEQDVLTFFKQRFPQILSIYGEEKLVKDFLQSPTNSIITLKCTPHHISAGALLLGDSAHAMVPFLGQATNCGFEDCLVFSGILKSKGFDLFEAAQEYSRIRCADTHAICDLSNDFYKQMGTYNTPMYLTVQEQIKKGLSILMPRTFMPLYTMLSFTGIPYATVVQRSSWQDRVVLRGLKLAGVSTLMVFVLLAYQCLPIARWMKLTTYSVQLQISRM